jgi:hypothetical protein
MDLLRDLWRVGRFTPVAPYQRFGYMCAALLVLSGLLHIAVYLADGGPWQGPLSWRKPIVFGLSFGITLATFSWLMGFLRPRRSVGWILLGALGVASVGEVVLISMQKWRGVASHFNEQTGFDASVFSMMGLLVSVVGLMVAVMTVWSFFRIDAPASLAWAIRFGLLLLLASQAVGAQMIAEGGNTFGAAGALKVPHAVTLHAVQVLPALALVLLLSSLTERRRLRIVGIGAAGYGLLIASTMVQTYGGRGPLDFSLVTTALAACGVGLLIASAVLALRGLANRTTQRVSGPPRDLGPDRIGPSEPAGAHREHTSDQRAGSTRQ